MEKFLFSDGTHAIKEVHSSGELQSLLNQTERKESIRVWKFNSNEWLGYEEFIKMFPSFKAVKFDIGVPAYNFVPETAIVVKPVSLRKKIGKLFLFLLIPPAIILVFNFTRPGKSDTARVNIKAQRPENVPVMDVDSLIRNIEINRGETIGKNTKNNLRLRNTWPDRILLQATAQKRNSNRKLIFEDVRVSLDNTTGYKIEKAIVKLIVWNNHNAVPVDTIQFTGIPDTGIVERSLEGHYKGDSLSIVFEQIIAPAFNFCYSDKVENRSGNYNDRWFCRE